MDILVTRGDVKVQYVINFRWLEQLLGYNYIFVQFRPQLKNTMKG